MFAFQIERPFKEVAERQGLERDGLGVVSQHGWARMKLACLEWKKVEEVQKKTAGERDRGSDDDLTAYST